ncbi:unnamed protein product [Lactuca saligna]|uniref:Uncharacterized protein n=1 Tax=Lactuca saligna TaxID=75948 RepID=A0AA35Z782_LACSI|nr:unnamed protein product [Lactuca saligna]
MQPIPKLQELPNPVVKLDEYPPLIILNSQSFHGVRSSLSSKFENKRKREIRAWFKQRSFVITAAASHRHSHSHHSVVHPQILFIDQFCMSNVSLLGLREMGNDLKLYHLWLFDSGELLID